MLVTPAFLRRLESAGIAEKELAALLARELLVPIVHGTTYEALREVSPMLGTRNGLNTAEDSLEETATPAESEGAAQHRLDISSASARLAR